MLTKKKKSKAKMISLILFHRSLTALKTVLSGKVLTSSQQCQFVLRLHLKLSLTTYIKQVGILLPILNKWNQEKVISKREQKFGKHDRGTKLSIVQRAAQHVHECTKCCSRIQNCTFQTVIHLTVLLKQKERSRTFKKLF